MPACPGGPERFRISAAQGRIRISGTTPSALLFGAGWYLKYQAHVHFSESGDHLAAGALPLPTEPMEMATPFPWRYALHENVDGYSAPYWDFARWQRELDFLARSGINAGRRNTVDATAVPPPRRRDSYVETRHCRAP